MVDHSMRTVTSPAGKLASSMVATDARLPSSCFSIKMPFIFPSVGYAGTRGAYKSKSIRRIRTKENGHAKVPVFLQRACLDACLTRVLPALLHALRVGGP